MIELNIYFIPSDLNLSASAVEQRYLDIVKSVKGAVTCPVAVKIRPYFRAMGHMAQRLAQAGTDGLVLFNWLYEPDIDLARLALVSDLELSSPYAIRLAGADVVMTTSSLLRHGIGHIKELLVGLEAWLDARNRDSLASIRGRMSHLNVADPTASHQPQDRSRPLGGTLSVSAHRGGSLFSRASADSRS